MIKVVFALEDVVLSPHIAGLTNEAQDAVAFQIAGQVREYLQSGKAVSVVNVPAVDFEQHEEMRHYAGLARNLGDFAARISSGKVKQISLGYSGRIADWETDLICNAAVHGVLDHFTGKVNESNAASIATAWRINVSEHREQAQPSSEVRDVLSLTLRTACSTYVIRGAVFNGNSPHLVGIDDVDLEMPLNGDLIFMRHGNAPGVAADVESVFEHHGIVLLRAASGASLAGGPDAVSVLQVGGVITAEVLPSLLRISTVCLARSIHFHPFQDIVEEQAATVFVSATY